MNVAALRKWHSSLSKHISHIPIGSRLSLKIFFHSEMRFNAMHSSLAFLPTVVFLWDYCLVIVWFRLHSIALVISVELITMY